MLPLYINIDYNDKKTTTTEKKPMKFSYVCTCLIVLFET